MLQNKRSLILLIVFIAGTITPFIPPFVAVEMFFLLMPFGLIFLFTLIHLINSLIIKSNFRKAIFIFSLLPIFISSQLLSGASVGKAQRFRSKYFIADLERINNEKGDFPTEFEPSWGITYRKVKNERAFLLEYSRGFMVTEKYDSRLTEWRNNGWND
jgi:hypothetical protein